MRGYELSPDQVRVMQFFAIAVLCEPNAGNFADCGGKDPI